MPEAITKYAVNSTLGTTDFEPLDKIIKGQRTYAPSDSVLALLGTDMNFNLFNPSVVKIPNVSFRSKVNGGLRVEFGGKSLDDSFGAQITFYAYEDGVSIASASAYFSKGSVISYCNLDFAIKPDRLYEFYTVRNDSAAVSILNTVKLKGQVVDLSMIEIGGDE